MRTLLASIMAHTAKAVANRFLDIADAAKSPLSPMKLQKLVYFAHGWNLGLFDLPLINEQVEAWKFGPVIPTVYHEFKGYGHSKIFTRAEFLDLDSEELVTFSIDNEPSPHLGRDKAVINRIWEVYGHYTPMQLSNITQEVGSPWQTIWAQYDGDPPKGTDIPQSMIREYFAKLAAE